MAFSQTAGLDLPSEFDVATYDAILPLAIALADESTDQKNVAQIFAAAWNGVAFRLRAACAYDEDFRATVERSRSPMPAERWTEERAFFGCTVSALSAVECFFMASYAIGAAKLSPSFPISKQGHLDRTIENVRVAFSTDYPFTKFSELLRDVIDSTELRNLKNTRNVLAHRGILPRRHFQVSDVHRHSAIPTNPKALAVDFDYAAQLDDETTRKHCEWAVKTT